MYATKFSIAGEVVAYCPHCGALETIYIDNGRITDTPHWQQRGNALFHRGCDIPCRLISDERRDFS